MNNLFRADLHCHSTCSDGTDLPLTLLQIAKESALQGLSITDHDTLDAYTPELFEKAAALDIRLLTGIELSSEMDGIPIHILGYGYDLTSKELKQFLEEMQKRRAHRNRAILHRLGQNRMPITEQELLAFADGAQAKRTIGRPHIAQLMVQKGYVASIQEAFERYLREGAPCYAPGIKYTPAEAIEQIHRAGGKAVLAHPHFIQKGSVVRKLLTLSFDGIECHYAKLPKNQEAPWLKIAKEKNLIPTGGSDYHGSIKPYLTLGCSWVGEDIFNSLSSRS